MGSISDLITYTRSQFNIAMSKEAKIREFHEGVIPDQFVYIRHIVEGVNRILYNNEIDACALLDATIKRDNASSKIIAQYLADEISHDEIIIRDLLNFGLSIEEVKNTELFFSTKLLIGYIDFSIKKDGFIAGVLWNWFVEWYSDEYNAVIVNSARNQFGDDKTNGMKQHLDIDESLNHTAFLDDIVLSYYHMEPTKVERYISDYIQLVKMYFIELLRSG